MPLSHQEPLKPVAGKVFLVGAGPGAADLITVRGRDCLASAEVVIYDYLANPDLVQLAPPEAERICLGKHGTGRLWNQDQINQALIDRALQGRRVVRLKGGDPSIFGCAAQEVAALVEQGIGFEIIPGITAGIAAAGSAGIPITHREFASAVAFVTGREDRDKEGEPLDYAALAHFPGTLIFYMGTTTVSDWSSGLLTAGLAPETPVAIVRRATHPDQTVLTTTLGSVASAVQTRPPLRPPVIFVVGRSADPAVRYPIASQGTVASQRANLLHRPLSGFRIWITRPLAQSAGLSEALEKLGATVIRQPVIEISQVSVNLSDSALIKSPSKLNWVVFSSANGVECLLTQLFEQGYDARTFAGKKIAAVGQGTARALAAHGLRADCIPTRFDAETLAETLIKSSGASNTQRIASDPNDTSALPLRALLVRGEAGRPVLRQKLEAAGWEVSETIVYRTASVSLQENQACEMLRRSEIHWTTATSPAIVHALHSDLGESLGKTRLITISPLTSQAARELGHEVASEALEASDQGLIEAILSDINRRAAKFT